MATGRIGTTPVLTTRWSKAPSAGTTSLSGLDDNSVSLVYSVGYEAVYQNGVLLSRGNDYTATNGTTITLTTATVAGDIIEVFANQLVPLTDAISKGQFTAKGALLSASAASTPAVLTVGTDGQVLKADSSTSTGLAWGAPTFVGASIKRDGVSTAITGGADYVVAFDSEQFDSDGFHSNTTNNSRMTIPTGKGGKYVASVTFNNNGNAPGSYQILSLTKNGAGYSAGGLVSGTYFRTSAGGANAPVGFTTIIDAVAGDYFEVVYTQANTNTGLIYVNFSLGYLGA